MQLRKIRRPERALPREAPTQKYGYGFTEDWRRGSCAILAAMNPAPLLGLLIVSLSAVARADEAVDKRLAAGEILVDPVAVAGSEMPGVKMEAVIDAPPASVWRLIDRCADYTQNMPRIAEAEELSRHGATVRCRIVLETLWPMKNVSALTRAEHTRKDGAYRRQWTLESGDYDKNDGSWTIEPFDAGATRSRVTYEVHAILKSSVPGFIRDYARKKGLPALIVRMRERVKTAAAN